MRAWRHAWRIGYVACVAVGITVQKGVWMTPNWDDLADSYEALYGMPKVLGSSREEQVRAIKGKYAHIEITHEREEQQPWQKSIMERLARMEQELAALQKRLDEYEGEL